MCTSHLYSYLPLNSCRVFSYQIFLWVGKDANETERAGSDKIGKTICINRDTENYVEYLVYKCVLICLSATDYVDLDPAGRKSTPITTIKQGQEPLSFTGWFHAWDPNLWEIDLRKYMEAKINNQQSINK